MIQQNLAGAYAQTDPVGRRSSLENLAIGAPGIIDGAVNSYMKVKQYEDHQQDRATAAQDRERALAKADEEAQRENTKKGLMESMIRGKALLAQYDAEKATLMAQGADEATADAKLKPKYTEIMNAHMAGVNKVSPGFWNQGDLGEWDRKGAEQIITAMEEAFYLHNDPQAYYTAKANLAERTAAREDLKAYREGQRKDTEAWRQEQRDRWEADRKSREGIAALRPGSPDNPKPQAYSGASDKQADEITKQIKKQDEIIGDKGGWFSGPPSETELTAAKQERARLTARYKALTGQDYDAVPAGGNLSNLGADKPAADTPPKPSQSAIAALKNGAKTFAEGGFIFSIENGRLKARKMGVK